FHKDKGIEVWVYNERRQKISTLIVKGTQWETKKLPESAVEGLYEIGGQPVIFLQQVINRTPSLFRIILNAQTGAVESEEIICTLPKYKTGSGWAMAYGGVKAMDFYVEKDPKSDNYAVVNFNTFSSESGERIEVVQFSGANGKHITENKAFYEVPISNMKYIDFIAMTVDKKSVYLCSYGYPDKWSSKEARLVISKLSTNDKQFNH